MNKYLLVINAGSSSIKFTVYQNTAGATPLQEEAVGQIQGIGSQPYFEVKTRTQAQREQQAYSVAEIPQHTQAITLTLKWLQRYLTTGELLAVGHRVVHGGIYYSSPVPIDASVLQTLESLIPLAPLHQPHNLAAIRALLANRPTLTQVACFDTAFHHTQPAVAQQFALPRPYTEAGIRRYGFHGLSYEYIASVLPDLDATLAKARVIVAHLGNGASLCALMEGRSVATTMGFSPLDGLVMGTRCGNIDPGVLLYLLDHEQMDAPALTQLLYHQSGLLGVSGIAQDMRTLQASTDPHAEEAIALFVYRAGREIGSLAAALGGLDALVFTGGIGEHAAVIRDKIAKQAAWLGLELDEAANIQGTGRISTLRSKVSAWVVETNENLMIAQHTLKRAMANNA